MSGLEILGAIASSIALAQAVKGTLKAVDFLRQNSEMKKDYHPLVALTIQELEEILEELNEIVEKYSRSRKAHDPKRYTDKVKWFSEARKIEELRERAQATKSNLHMAITFRVSCMVDRGNVRQEVLFHRVTQQLTYYTQETHNISQSLPRLLAGPHYMPESSTTTSQAWTQDMAILNKPDSPATEENRTAGISQLPFKNNADNTVTTIKDETFVCVTTIQPLGTRLCRSTSAAEGGMLDALREQPWAIDELDEFGNAPIHVAVISGNFEALEQLIEAKANITQKDAFGSTPLMEAVRRGDKRMTQKLLEYKECRRLIGQVDLDGRSALHFAAQAVSSACVRLLLEAGAPASKPNGFNETPMHYLSYGEREDHKGINDIIELLQVYRANIESKDHIGQTPVLTACVQGNVPVLRALVIAGGSLSAIGFDRRGILHTAADSNNFDVVNYLAQQDLKDIDPQLRNLPQGYTPLGSLRWIYEEYQLHERTLPTQGQQQDFIELYFDLLIRDLERHMSTLGNVCQAIEDKDAPATAELLDSLIKKNKGNFRQELVDWYRGLQFYVAESKWACLKETIRDEYDETAQKAERAALARGKKLADPEMKEFF
ncbi:hypothetical protein FBEOM_5898 [Fusarium beomiforme]|uniref:Uncharacterized protein n=1 Tax=Fusarium beomiforme TaxID=44412 RepID=A0A9P5AKC8_9HYPO|nr:hypothetical protein FBEOM_5898 [Fusarium beomiforme]